MDGISGYRPLQIRRGLWSIPLAAIALIALGWAALGRAEQVTEGPAIHSIASGGSRLLRQQIVWSVLALGAMAGVAVVDYRRFARAAPLLFATVVAALVAVYAFPTVNGAHRWIRLGGIGMQPSEFAKVAFILALAGYLAHRDLTTGFTSLLWPLALAVLPVVLILKEPDLGTSLIFLPVLLAVLFAAGARQRDLVRLVAAGLMLLPLLWSQMSHEQRSRITALSEQNGPREAATPDGFHLDQAKRMFALGSVWGSIFTADAEPADEAVVSCRLPEPYTDSIFCVVGERFGLIGAGALLLLYTALVFCCVQVALRLEEPFGRLLAVGVAALFATEMLINTAMLTGLLPITGVSLPLVSYGGSGLVAHALALGLVLSAGRRAAEILP